MKKVIICSDKKGKRLQGVLEEYIKGLDCEVELFSEEYNLQEYLDKIVIASEKAVRGEVDRVIFIDEVGAKSFMISSKVKGMVTACISDEHSARMTRDHNGSFGLAIGYELVGDVLAKNLVKLFVENKFSAGRHMVRIDMLNKMA
jgi:galactose-6-phosphate isomerase